MSGITLKEIAAASVPTPATDKATLFLNASGGAPAYKNDAGTVASLVGAPGQGVPTGGTAGQALTKINGADYNTQWSTIGALTDGDKGDITVSSSGAAWAIDAGVVTYAKMQDVSATKRVLGRNTAGAGDAEEVTFSQFLDWVGSAANGDILYRSGGAWTRLGVGSDTHVLTLASGLPTWAASASGMTNPMTTTGDIIYSSSGSTPARLGVGTNGHVLTLAAGVPTWAAPTGSVAWGAITGTLASQTDLQSALDAKGAAGIPQNSQSTAYTAVLADANKHLLHPSADTTARIFTIPANSSVAYPVGTALTIVNQNGAGVITIAITTDTMRLAGPGTTGSRTLAANGIATALKITSTEWIISGTGLT